MQAHALASAMQQFCLHDIDGNDARHTGAQLALLRCGKPAN